MQNMRSRIVRQGAPATLTLSVLMLGTFLISYLAQRDIFSSLRFIVGKDASPTPWSFLTYPFSPSGKDTDVLWFVIAILWLWNMGGAAERDLGTKRFSIFWLAASLLGALGVWLGCIVLGQAGVALTTGLIPVSAVTVLWGTLNARQDVLLLFVIPAKASWMAWLAAAIVVGTGGGTGDVKLGLFALLPLAVAYLYGARKLPLGMASAPSNRPSKVPRYVTEEYLSEVKRREQARAERERLRKLFESSIDEDKDKR